MARPEALLPFADQRDPDKDLGNFEVATSLRLDRHSGRGMRFPSFEAIEGDLFVFRKGSKRYYLVSWGES